MHTRLLVLTVVLLTGFMPVALGEDAGIGPSRTENTHLLLPNEHEIHGTSWVVWRFVVNEPGTSLEWTYDGVFTEGSVAHWGHFVVRPQGPGGWLEHRPAASYHASAKVLDVHAVNAHVLDEYVLDGKSYGSTLGVGEHFLIVIVGTNGRFDGTVTVQAPASVELVGKTTGLPFTFTDEDLSSTASAKARVVAHASLMTKVTLDGVASVDITHGFWGHMLVVDGGLKQYHASWQGPNGSGGESSTNKPYYVHNFLGAESGSYTFRLHKDVQARVFAPPFFIVYGGDIVFP